MSIYDIFTTILGTVGDIQLYPKIQKKQNKNKWKEYTTQESASICS